MVKNEKLILIIGAIAPLFVSCVLLGVQWGSVTNQMQTFENNLQRVIDNVDKTDRRTASAIEKTNDTLVELQKDMAYVRGKMKDESK